MVFLGILGDDSNVPGTIPGFLEKARIEADESSLNPNLKYDTSGKVPVLLVPQPSDDPKDPLNLPRWRRDLNLLMLCLMGVLATTLSPILAADSLTLLFVFRGKSFTEIAWLTGYHLLAVGLSGFFFVGSARVWGKRHVYLIGSLLIIASCAWAGTISNQYGQLMGARVLQGIGLAPFEALINSSVADLYFVHERGWRMALSNLSVFGGAFFTPIIVGVISARLGWQWTFTFVAIFAGAAFPLMFFFCFETAWPRSVDAENILFAQNVHTGGLTAPETPESSTHADEKGFEGPSSVPENAATTAAARDTNPVFGNGYKANNYSEWEFWQSLYPFNGRKTDENFFKILIRPLPLFLNPGILWSCLIQGCIIGWTVEIGIVLAAIFLGPPLYFGAEKVGFMYTGSFIGALCGFIICGTIADPGIRFLTRLNRGVYEPEFRILLIGFLVLILGGIGLYGFGVTSNDLFTYGAVIPDVFFGFEVAAMICGAVASALYIADAHRDVAIEGYTCLLIFKNLFSFGLTIHGFDWLVARGVKQVFVYIFWAHFAVTCLSFPMYVFGKLNRKYTAKYDLLRYLHLRSDQTRPAGEPSGSSSKLNPLSLVRRRKAAEAS